MTEEINLLEICEKEAENAATHLEENYNVDVETPVVEEDVENHLEPYIGFKRKLIRKLPFQSIDRPRAAYTNKGVNLNYNADQNTLTFDIQDERILINNEDSFDPETLPGLIGHEVGHAAVKQNNWFMALKPGYMNEKVLDGLDEAAGYMAEYAVDQETGFFETPEIPENPTTLTADHRNGLKILEEYGRTVLTDPQTVYEDITGEEVSLEDYVLNMTSYPGSFEFKRKTG